MAEQTKDPDYRTQRAAADTLVALGSAAGEHADALATALKDLETLDEKKVRRTLPKLKDSKKQVRI